MLGKKGPELQYPAVVLVERIIEQDLSTTVTGMDARIYLYNIYPSVDAAERALTMSGLKKDALGIWYTDDDNEDRYIIASKPGSCITNICYEDHHGPTEERGIS